MSTSLTILLFLQSDLKSSLIPCELLDLYRNPSPLMGFVLRKLSFSSSTTIEVLTPLKSFEHFRPMFHNGRWSCDGRRTERSRSATTEVHTKKLLKLLTRKTKFPAEIIIPAWMICTLRQRPYFRKPILYLHHFHSLMLGRYLVVYLINQKYSRLWIYERHIFELRIKTWIWRRSSQ